MEDVFFCACTAGQIYWSNLTDMCGTGQVRFVCAEDQAFSILSIKEAPTCKYTVVINVPRLCEHPYAASPLHDVVFQCALSRAYRLTVYEFSEKGDFRGFSQNC